MRFSTAWAKVAAQNVTLKIATVILAGVSVVQLIVISSLASRNLPIIERGCFSRAAVVAPTTPSKDEIKAFLSEALPMRFDSSTYIKDGFLSLEEITLREKEQATLKQRQIVQKVVISDINVEGKEIQVLADRLLSIGKLRSALTLNLKVSIQQTNRTEANPYGLVLGSSTQIEEKDKP